MGKKDEEKEPVIATERIPRDAMLEHIIRFIVEIYEPSEGLADADLTISLRDIFMRVHEFYPISFYSESDIMEALLKAGFSYDTFGAMNFYWKMKEKSKAAL